EKRLRQVLADKSPALLKLAEFRLGRLSRGFVREDASGGEAMVSDHELFGRLTPARPPRRRRFSGAPIADFAELRDGDYVVHVANGIARFEGLRTMESNGAEQDFLVLRFADDARIYVPLSHIDLVQRYIGLGENAPQLSKLGSAAWNRRKEAAEKAVRDVAQELLATQARRLSSPGLAMPPDDQLVREFEAAFPYDETPDQLSADADIRRDQQTGSPMERLLCGDVGFGKTEMAIRAAFRAVNAGLQAAILVPTTILAEQHRRTFSERMADYPVRVESLSRFRSPAEQEEIARDIRNGRVDVVIGTHRLLSDDISFRSLGLVVIDEEQKFGVEHKERLKRLQAGVDVLTMTATPIPRTLHMSLLGLRDISNLTTAPRERHSVKTIVIRRSWDAVRRAALRELSRGGQCFFLHNRVHNIAEVAAKLGETVPEARIGIGHGQMAEGELLTVMRSFLDGKIDILVCTTIIESGVDIPNVNTLFVNDADRFGLSELHQLRGRVGRYKHQAYAYFLAPEKRPVSPEADKRLQALQEYAELGAGFRIAMRDLEIRGAGNLLGIEQSGHIHLIGFDLYCRLLEKAVAAEKGEPLEEEGRAELELGHRAFIPGGYISTEAQRIEFYRRLTRVRSREELDAIRRHVRDRYGPPPPPVERCFQDQGLRLRLLDAGLETLGRVDGALRLGFSERAAGRGVSLLRQAGFKVDSLRDRLWRVDLPEAKGGLPTPEQAEALTDRILEVLEKSRGREAGRPASLKPAAAWTRAKPVPASPSPRQAPEPPAPATEPEVPEPNRADKPARRKKLRSLRPAATKAAANRFPAPATQSPAGGAGEAENLADAPEAAKGKKTGKAKKMMEETADLPVLTASGKPLDFFSSDMLEGLPRPLPAAEPDGPSAPIPFSDAGKDAVFAELMDSSAGVKVLGIEPYLAKGQVGVVVPETAFNPIRFEIMTLVIKSELARRFFLRCVGSGVSPGRRVVLRLQASGPEEASRAAESFLAAGEALLFDGIRE
ncbi:MAG: transcription-repair coupling factor, partial [Planctomycetota bacterium]|nr:transcription-repair coupling factor [Planctomycetota bacterium]